MNHNPKGFSLNIGHSAFYILLAFSILCSPLFAQDVLFDDVNNCHSRGIWVYLLDTLSAHGANIHYVADEGWANLNDMDMVWLECPTVSYSAGIKTALQNFARDGGKIVIGEVFHRGSALNDLLTDPGWQTTLSILDATTSYIIDYFYPFSPFTDGVTQLDLSGPAVISCGEHAYPFAFGDAYYSQPVAAISYPFVHEANCSTFIVLVTGTHSWETYFSIVADNYRFASNILLCAAGIPGFEIDGCETPEGIIEVDSVSICVNPGDVATIWGMNIYPDITVYVGGVAVTVTGYGPDSTWLTFLGPDLPQGIYTIQLERDGIRFYGGTIQIYCAWVDINVVASGCFMFDDTVYFSGEDFVIGGSVIEFRDPSGTPYTCEYDIVSVDSGWCIVPATLDTAAYSYFYIVVTNPAGNSDRAFVQIPCPCPGQEDLYRSIFGIHPGDTRNPIVIIITPDSCIFVDNTLDLSWTTSADSFMATYEWALREPINPIMIYYVSRDTITTAWINDRDTTTYPYFSADSGHWDVVVQATDWFGNTGSDTMEICFKDDTVCMSGFAWADTCDPDTVFFRIRHEQPVDNSTIVMMFAGVLYTIDSAQVQWINDSTLIFIIDSLALDTLNGLYSVGLADILEDLNGHGLCPDTTEGFAATFRIPCCYGLRTELWCPIPSMAFVVCDPFPVSFIVVDTSHIDPPAIGEFYFSAEINGMDMLPSLVMSFTGTTDSVYIEIDPIWNDGDTVIVVLDSVFTHRGCKTIP